MIKCKENYIGMKFSHLTVIKQVNDYVSKSGRPKARFLCRCDCNKLNPNTIIVRLDSLKNGHTSSCGCVKSKTTTMRNTKRKKPLSDEETLELNLIDDNHKEFGKCRLSKTGKWLYFSMCDYDAIKNYHWYVYVDKRTGYCSLKTMFDGKPMSMHQILHIQKPDHINRNPLDNRRENLDEYASGIIQAQNRGLQQNNISGCKGVGYIKSLNKWRSRIKVDRKEIYLGLFDSKEDAIVARLNAEMKYFDKRAWQNKLMEVYRC